MFFSLSNLPNIKKVISDLSKPKLSEQAVLHYCEAGVPGLDQTHVELRKKLEPDMEDSCVGSVAIV